ncbi:MAG TPA: hypothetical protein VEU51_04175, partial [Candidatus Acidoferrales bacterium]|nr:hypothetical protein [Candidatus Acidoferrales bacterium]
MGTDNELSQAIEKSLPAEEARRLSIFAERLYARATVESREDTPPEHRLATAKAAFEFFSTRAHPVTARVESAPGDETLTIVETATHDRPFIVDSLLEYFHQLGATVRTMLHPVFKVARDRAGRIASFEQATAAERGESFVHAELELAAGAEKAREIEREVVAILREVGEATADFDKMTGRALQICEETAANRELVEVRDFLRWLIHGGFVFLGYRRYAVSGADGAGKIVADAGTELGILREDDESRFRTRVSFDELSPARRKLFFDGAPLVVGKTQAHSRVHRRASMDSVSIRRTDARGRAAAFDNFIGLFTSKAYAEEAQHIPVLRAKLAELLGAERAEAGSHDYKEIVSAFNSFPKDELFRAPVDELRAQIRQILDVKSEAAVRLMLTPDVRHGNVIALVLVPREAFSVDVRHRIQAALGAGLRGTLVYYYLALGESYTARLHFCFAAEPPKPAVIRELETTIAALARRWEDRLHDRLVEKFGGKRGRALAARWAGAFSAEYQAAIDVARAVDDIEDVEALAASERRFVVETESHRAHEKNGASEIRMIGMGEAPMLSDLMPTLHHFGVNVLAEDAHELHPKIEGRLARAYLQVFSVQGPGLRPFGEFPGASLGAAALTAVREGLAADDSLNALTLSAGLAWREVALLRAYLAAAFQMRLAPA